jgi:hypothetical protein
MSNPSPTEPARIAREKRTIQAMIEVFCRARHRSHGALCPECQELYGYAVARLDRCPFGAEKTTCAKCPVHCYKPAMRERIREVMRFAGPRMLFHHPVLAALHVLDDLRGREPS